MSLRVKAIAGIKWTSISMLIVSIIQLAQLVILARFLDAEIFGMMAILLIVLGFSQAYIDMGVSNAIIHRQNVTNSQLSSLYWLGVLVGLLMTSFVFLLSPPIAEFFDEPQLKEPLMLLSSVFFIMSIGNQYKVLYQKDMQFDVIAKNEIFSVLAAFLFVILAVLNGYGIYALVGSRLVQALIGSLMYLVRGVKSHYVPSLKYKHAELSGFYSFGLYQMGERSIDFIGSRIDKIIVGKLMTAQLLGYYDLAMQLIMYPLIKINPVVMKVLFPLYAKMQQNSDKTEEIYILSLKVVIVIIAPILVYMSAFSREIVYVAFGEGWELTSELVVALSYVGLLRLTGSPGGALLLANGYARITFYWNLIWVLISGFCLYLAVKFSNDINVLPYAWLVVMLTVGNVWHIIVAKICSINYLKLIRSIFFPFVAMLVTVYFSRYIVDSVLHIVNYNFKLLVSLAMCFLIYIPIIYRLEGDAIKRIYGKK